MSVLGTIPLPIHSLLLLLGVNEFMLFAWHGHLQDPSTFTGWVAVLASWSELVCDAAVWRLNCNRS